MPLVHDTNASLSHEGLLLTPQRIVLVTIYSVVLLGGGLGVAVTLSLIKSNLRSMTTVAVLNLVVVHFVFLLTVPFRIYYYATGSWKLSSGFCKAVSNLIHAHMYVSFLFYIVILVLRYLAFYGMTERVEFYRKLHAVVASVAVWAIALLVGLPVFLAKYVPHQSQDELMCFHFSDMLQADVAMAVLNYTLSVISLVVASGLTCCQVHVLWRVVQKHGASCKAHQEFWAQMKSLCFVLVMLICFVPYLAFRLYYVSHTDLQAENEVILALTALSCLDTLTFLGKGACETCSLA